jgi:dolichyl-phosphate-mannose--protein O-mannosyl transferase
MLLGGVVLRIQGVASPPRLTFDEKEFVENAQHYAVGMPDVNDHPPLGKLLIAVGMLLFGYDSLGWRFVPLVFGVQSVYLSYWLGRELFQDRRAGWMAAAFVAADGFFIAYSRSALFDGMMVCFVLWSMVVAVAARNWRGVLLSGILIGLATSVKWSGVVTVLPAATAVIVLGRASVFSILWLAVVPVVHTLVWMGALKLTGQPSDPVATWKVIVGLYQHHLGLGQYHNALNSPWYSWPVLYHPIVVKYSTSGMRSRYASSLGNLVLTLVTTVSMVAIPLATLATAVHRRFRRYLQGLVDLPTTKAALVMVLGWWAFLLPWIATGNSRGSYTFHHYYLPCYAFALVMLAGIVARLERKRPGWVAGFVGVVVAVSAYYAPVWGEFDLTVAEASARLWFHNWQPW